MSDSENTPVHAMWPSRTSLLVLGLIIAAGAFIRLSQTTESLWLDELHSSWVVSCDLVHVWERAAIGNQPPLYFWLLWITKQVLGSSEPALRFISVVSGTGLIALVFVYAWRWTSSVTAALASAAMVMVDRNMVFYATEARPYALLQLVAFVQLAQFWVLVINKVKPPWPGVIGYFVATSMLLYLHYTAVFIIATEVALLATACLFKRTSVKTCLLVSAAMGFAGLLALPLVGDFTQIMHRRESWGRFESEGSVLLNAFWALRLPLYIIVPLVLTLGASLLFREGVKQKLETAWTSLGFVCCWSVLPVLILVVVGGSLPPVLLRRYCAVSLVGPMVLAGALIGYLPRQALGIVATVLLLVASAWQSGIGASLWERGHWISDRKEDWRAAVTWVNEHNAEDKPVLVHSGLIEANDYAVDGTELQRQYCLLPVNNIYELRGVRTDFNNVAPLPGVDSPRFFTLIADAARERNACWVMLRMRRESLQPTIDRMTRGINLKVGDQRAFGGVQVLLLTRSKE